jgi:hypothetical protein
MLGIEPHSEDNVMESNEELLRHSSIDGWSFEGLNSRRRDTMSWYTALHITLLYLTIFVLVLLVATLSLMQLGQEKVHDLSQDIYCE